MRLLKYGAVLLFLMSLWGCGKGNGSAPAVAAIDPATGKHPSGMAVAGTGGAHVEAYFQNPAYCEGCHGKTEDRAGGIVKVSCSTVSRSGMSCHAGKFPHGAGFEDPVVHGAKARSIATGTFGMAFCKNCHGSDYNLAVTSTGLSCITCHKKTTPASNAPHAGNWLNGTFRHSAADQTNAAACAQCHRNGINSAMKPNPLVSASTAPGCFNGTLCHYTAGHGLPYALPSQHGPAARGNIPACASCHATGTPPRFNVVLPSVASPSANMASGCETCHVGTQANLYGAGRGLAHPYIWLPGRGTNSSHANATRGGVTAPYCTPCHGTSLNGVGGSAPSCMSPGIAGIRCHISSPAATTNGSCTTCHGGNTTGPYGAAFPNTNYKHSAHFTNIPGLTCAACHLNLGPPQVTHANGTINTTLNGIFNDGGAAIAAGGCTNISCHGGKPTPPWDNTTYTNYVNDPTGANCTVNCHTSRNPPVQYIDVFNGNNLPSGYGTDLHDVHLFYNGTVCTDCHSLTKLQLSHFSGLSAGSRPFIPGDSMAAGFAAGTIGGSDTKIIPANPYSYDGATPGPILRGSCLTGTSGCHETDTRYWFNK